MSIRTNIRIQNLTFRELRWERSAKKGRHEKITAVQKSSGTMVNSLVIKSPEERLCSRLSPRAEERYCRRAGSQTTAVARAQAKLEAANKMCIRDRF